MPWNLQHDDIRRLTDIVKGLPGFDSERDRWPILVDALGLSNRARGVVSTITLEGSPDEVARRIIQKLDAFGQREEGEEWLELFLIRAVVPKVDLGVGEEIHEIIRRCRIDRLSASPPSPPAPSPSPTGAFAPDTEALGSGPEPSLAARPAVLSGKARIEIKRGLVTRWRDVADYFTIPYYEKLKIEAREDEPEHLLRWLEERKRLGELRDAFNYLGFDDLIEVLNRLPR